MRFRFPALRPLLEPLGIHVTDDTVWSLVTNDLGFRASAVQTDRFGLPATIFVSSITGRVEGSTDTFGYLEYEPMGQIFLPSQVLTIQ